MSDKKPSKETLLKKKSSRKKRAVSKVDKEIDMEKVKELILKEMTNARDRASINNFSQNINDLRMSSSSLSEYDLKYKKYLQEEFTYNHFVILNRTISDSQNCPVDLRNNYALHKNLYNTVKILLMNELEIVYFSIFLDNLGWITKEFDLEENLLMTGISVKIYLNTNYNFIIEFLKHKNDDINDRFNKWLSHKKDYESILKIHPRDLNERFYKLKKPFNSHCKVNYVDYNCVVDQILQMSLPYCDTKSASTHLNRFNNNNANTINNASNLSYSVKEEKQANKNAKNNVNNQYDNSVKTVHEQPDMSPASQIKIEDQRFLNSNNANNHTQNFVKTLNSNHSISFNPAHSSNLNQTANTVSANLMPIQQVNIPENVSLPKLDVNDFNIRKFDSNASFGLFNENSNYPSYFMNNNDFALYSRMQSQNIPMNDEEYKNNFFKGISRYNFEAPKNTNNNDLEAAIIDTNIKKEAEGEQKPQDLSFQEQISFEAKNKDNSKQNEGKETAKNQSIFTKTENNIHSFKSAGQFDKKDSFPQKTYKLDLKSNDINKTFGNPFNKNTGFFNNNSQSNIKNNIVLIDNTNNNDQKNVKVVNTDINAANNNKDKNKDNNKNQNILKKHESVSQFYN